MEIEFKNLDDRVDVIEHAVRSLKPEYSEGEPSEHLQARLFVRDFEESCVDYSISYYGEHGELPWVSRTHK